MNDYIRKAVELASDKWPWDYHKKWYGSKLDQFILDALAAQLVRQVDALPVGEFPDDAPTTVYILNGNTDVWHKRELITQHKSKDRTMNTLRAIIDSKVLE